LKLFQECGEGIKENDGGGESSYDRLSELLQMSQCTSSTTVISKITK
jgi:hypothetical protein